MRYLTRKRKEFLEHFRNHTVLSISDIYRLLGAKNETQERAVRRMMKQTFEAGYTLRQRVWNPDEISETTPHWHYVYRLSKHGADVVHVRAKREQSSSSVEHDETTERAMVELKTKWPDKVYFLPGELKRTINPDKAFGLQKKDSWFYFFWETVKHRQDLSRTDFKGLIKRLQRYDSYRKSDQCKQDWKLFRDFRVLLSVPTEELRSNFLVRLAKELPYTWIWVTTEAEWARDITAEIWLTPRDYATTSHSLLNV
jgi:hypothetical protein